MPTIRLDPPDWVMKFEQEGQAAELWNPGDADPINISRAHDIAVTAQIANLGVSSDRAIPKLTVLLETARAAGHPTNFTAVDADVNSERLASGAVRAQSITIKCTDLPTFADPWLLVMATDQWNALRGSATARAAIVGSLEGTTFALPLNAALLRLSLA